MRQVQSIVAGGLLGVLLITGCVAPWLFGAWEMWWFWPFAALLAIGAVLAGIAMLQGAGSLARPVSIALYAGLPFLTFMLVRWWLGDSVFLDAERAVWLQVGGFGVAVLTACFLPEQHATRLFWGLYLSLGAMAVYGILNHILAGSQNVLWAPRYAQYTGRAMGPYFCPDHFAGAMELFLCMGIGLVLNRTCGAGKRILGFAACGLGTAGALMSLSRGAGITLVVIAVLVVLWGFHQWPLPVRNAWRMVSVSVGLLVLIGAFAGARSYRQRFVTYGGLNSVTTTAEEPLTQQIMERLRLTSRGRMFAGAWRSWQTAPWLGIGPGMHRHLWPVFADAGDGDQESGVWPTLINDDFHSYEVHSDWLQLLQEYGVVGLALFLMGCVGLAGVFLWAFKRTSDAWSRYEIENTQASITGHERLLAAFLALGAMGFHSLGDFNLQMPGTVWMLGILVGLGIRAATAAHIQS